MERTRSPMAATAVFWTNLIRRCFSIFPVQNSVYTTLKTPEILFKRKHWTQCLNALPDYCYKKAWKHCKYDRLPVNTLNDAEERQPHGCVRVLVFDIKSIIDERKTENARLISTYCCLLIVKHSVPSGFKNRYLFDFLMIPNTLRESVHLLTYLLTYLLLGRWLSGCSLASLQ